MSVQQSYNTFKILYNIDIISFFLYIPALAESTIGQASIYKEPMEWDRVLLL